MSLKGILSPPQIGHRPVVRVITPCGAIGQHLEALERGMGRLESEGCEIRWDPRRGDANWRGYLAGPDQVRSDELVAAFQEPEVDIVWVGRGGSGAARIIPSAVEELRDLEPRILVGFSDCTSLLNTLNQELGWVTFHGPVITTLGRSDHEDSASACLKTLRGESHHLTIPVQEGRPIAGRLRGGNLTVLTSMSGTPIAPRPGDADIWFFEDVQEAPYRLDRLVWQLKSSGMLASARAICLGDFDLEHDAEQAVHRMFRDEFNIPIYIGFPAGHRGVLQLAPVGCTIQIRPEEGWIGSETPWVQTDG